MIKKYLITADENNKINWVGINTDTDLIVKEIVDRDDPNKYMDQLKNINNEYGDFFSKFTKKDFTLLNDNYLETKFASQKALEKNSLVIGESYKKSNFDYDQMFIVSNEKDLPRKSNISDILDEVSRNSISVSEDNKITPHGIATKIAQLRDGMSEFYPGNIDLAINFNFVRVVDKDGKHIDNDISKKIEDSIVKVTANLTSFDTMFFTEPVNAFLDRRISGYVDFSKFIKNLSDLGYSMASNDWMMSDRKFEKNYISELYDENGNLELSVLKSTANTDDRFGCIFNKTDNLKRADNDKKNGISR